MGKAHKLNGVLTGMALTIPFLAFGQCQYRHDGAAILNDNSKNCTPGDARPVTANQLCDPSFRTGDVRNVPESLKLKVCAEYGIDKAHCKGSTYEIDHLISLEIGGSNDIKNLWPQPYAGELGARKKDVIEGFAARSVCSGKMTLEEAQKGISDDWYKFGKDQGILK